MKTLAIDLESYSETDIMSCGAYKYVEDPTFEVMLLAYSFDLEPALVIDLAQGEPIPQAVLDALIDPTVIKTAYNAPFERTCLAKHLGKAMPPEQWQCSMVLASECGLPLGLGMVSSALNFGEDKAKMKEGKALIRFFCIPCKATKKNGGRTRNRPEDDPLKWETFTEYCRMDVEAENEIKRKLITYPLEASENRLWELDQKINDKGVLLDEKLIREAISFDLAYKERLTEEAIRLTGLSNPSSAAQLKAWLLETEGIEVESLNKKAMPEVFEQMELDLSREVLELRSELTKTSVRKYDAMLRCRCADGRARGLFQFAGTKTLRWSGRLIQLQNLPQNHIETLSSARELVRAGSYENFEVIYDNVSSTLSELIRTAIVPAPSHKFLISDFSAIEARVIAWFAGEQWVIEEFEDEGLIYEATASQMFGVPKHTIEKGGENHHLRAKGKVAILACIAEDSLVLTNQGLIPIQDVTEKQLLWDGENWVKHKGVIYKGEREVITYDGLTATEDHLVWAEGKKRPIHFRDASSSGAHLLQTGFGRKALRMGGNNQSRETLESKTKSLLCADEMHKVQKCSMDKLEQSQPWFVKRLSELFATRKTLSKMAVQKDVGCKKQMLHKHASSLQRLWGKRNKVRIPKCGAILSVACEESRSTKERVGNRPYKQQWELCSREHKIFHQKREYRKSAYNSIVRMGEQGLALCKNSCLSKIKLWFESGASYLRSLESCSRKKKELERNTTKVRVYDILNCGPNHRFTVSNCLVHNCGFGGSVGALKAFGADKMGMSESDMQETVTKWRAANPNIVKWWWSVDRAAMKAVQSKGQAYDEIGKILFSYESGLLFITLPSGHRLCYFNAEIQDGRFGKPVVSYMGLNQITRQWTRMETYGPKLVENIVQAAARDCLAESMIRLDEAGFDIRMHVHDEVICEEPIEGRNVQAMSDIMGTPVAWGKGLPLRADGYETLFYRKD